MTPLSISLSLCSLSIVLQIIVNSVESRGARVSPGDDGWVTVNKTTLCRISQEYGICSRDFVINDILAEIGRFGPSNMTENIRKIIPASKDGTWGMCASALRQTVCEVAGQPLCSSDDEKVNSVNRTSVNRKASCDKLWSSCGFVVYGVARTYFSQYCAEVLWRKFTNMTCKAVDGDFNGVCPQPIGKVPVFYTHVYQMNLLRLRVPFRILSIFQRRFDVMSFSCFASVKELLCTPIYCSDNDTSTVMIQNKRDCRRTTSCIAEGMEKYPKFKDALDQVKRFVEDRCDLFVEEFENDGGIGAEPEVVAMEMKSSCKTLLVQGPMILVALSLRFLW